MSIMPFVLNSRISQKVEGYRFASLKRILTPWGPFEEKTDGKLEIVCELRGTIYPKDLRSGEIFYRSYFIRRMCFGFCVHLYSIAY